MIFNDTIVAPATTIGRSGIGIIRISGTSVLKLIKIFLKISMKERIAYYTPFLDVKGNILDYGIALFFSSPRSFTGEDILEFQGHGNPILLDLLIKNLLFIKHVRIARPGEFSERAFLNNKIDLIQAEAISDLINAQSESLIKASLRSLRGNFSKKIKSIISQLKNIYTQIEAIINFPDEINESVLLKNIKKKLIKVINLIKKLIYTTCQSRLLQKGIKVVIIGPPNAGKSSLLNFLSNQTVSIVTNIPGTTRDLIRKNVWIHGICYKFIDTAGLHKSDNDIEKIGIKLAKKKICSCDHIFLVLDITHNQSINNKFISKCINNLKKNQSITIIFNKIDLTNQESCVSIVYKKYISIYLSIKNRLGVDFLKKRIQQISSTIDNIENVFLARRRHLYELEKSLKHLLNGKKDWRIHSRIELLSEHISLSIKCLLNITGKFSTNDLLNKIFSDFCIGK